MSLKSSRTYRSLAIYILKKNPLRSLSLSSLENPVTSFFPDLQSLLFPEYPIMASILSLFPRLILHALLLVLTKTYSQNDPTPHLLRRRHQLHVPRHILLQHQPPPIQLHPFSRRRRVLLHYHRWRILLCPCLWPYLVPTQCLRL